MSFSLKNQILKPNVIGISCYLESNGHVKYNAIRVKKEVDAISVLDILNSTDDIEILKRFVPKKSCIYLNIEGPGVLIRSKELIDNKGGSFDPIKLFHGINNDEFIIQSYLSNELLNAFAVKKAKVDQILKLIPHDSFVLGLFVGPISLFPFNKFLSSKSDAIQTKDLVYNLLSHEMIFLESKGSVINYDFLDKGINSENVLAYFSCLHHFSKDVKIDQTNSNFLLSNNDEYKFFTWTRYTFLGLLIGIFIILIINTYFFTDFNSKQATLNKTLEDNSSLIDQMNEIQDQILKSEKFIQFSGIDEVSTKSLYIDRICSLMPFEIILTDINFSPFKNQSKSRNFNDWFEKYIQVKGEINSIDLLNRWLELLSKEAWVTESQLSVFQINSKTGKGEFILRIYLQ